jgi:ankyrin repeat protein
MRVVSPFTLILPFALLSSLQAQSTTKLPPPAKVTVDYDQHVKPILAAKCFSCHGPKQQQSGLRLDLRQNALRGGDYGVVIVPGDSAGSKLIIRLSGPDAGLQMPPTGALPSEDIGILRAWIDQGAEMPGRANESSDEKKKITDPKVQAFLDTIHRHDLVAFRKTLAASKALAQSADAAGSTALMHAAYAGTLETMRDLLAAGADPNAHNEREATALHWAIADAAKVKLLLSKGADVRAKTVDGRTALYLAALRTDGAPIVQVLLDAGSDPNARMITGSLPLFAAVAVSLESAQILLAKGADPNARSETGSTALMAAAPQNPRAVALLVARGADVNARTKRGETALANAADRGNLESVKLLLDKGANVNAVDYRGYTPLMHAAYCDDGPVELVRLLLANGANVNAKGEGETPLSLAAKRGETEMTRLLREAQKTSRQSSVAAIQ